ncbi:MAG: response regulator [Candidatus Cloacimonetes bacterium]|nr:response regulator [Candidatus Cloacimonadota bacterium]
MSRILIVEDESMIAADIKYTLEQYKHEVIKIFSNGEDVIKNVTALNPDLILMDIMLEGNLTGIQTGKAILEENNIPIILLTAYADAATVNSAKEISPYGYLLKPFEAKELNAAIEIALIKHNTEKKLEENRAKFESIFLSNPEPCVYLDTDFTVLDINPRFSEFFGYSPAEVKGKNIDDLIIPDTKKDEAAKLSDQSLYGYVYFDTKRLTKTGDIVSVSISAAPILIKGKATGTFVIYKDITERKKVEKERKELIIKLKKTLDEVKTLEGMIPICSHCKKIRDDSGFWGNVEHYIAKHSNVDFSHGICPDCLQKHFPKQYKKMKESGKI